MVHAVEQAEGRAYARELIDPPSRGRGSAPRVVRGPRVKLGEVGPHAAHVVREVFRDLPLDALRTTDVTLDGRRVGREEVLPGETDETRKVGVRGRFPATTAAGVLPFWSRARSTLRRVPRSRLRVRALALFRVFVRFFHFLTHTLTLTLRRETRRVVSDRTPRTSTPASPIVRNM